MTRRALFAGSALAVALGASPALALDRDNTLTWFPHGSGGGGGPTTCMTYTSRLADDGCTTANTNAMFRVTNTGTINGVATGYGMSLKGLANKSAVSWPLDHPQPFNVAAVDFGNGPDATKLANAKDPATINNGGETIAGCQYFPTGTGNFITMNPNGPALYCKTATAALDGYWFAPWTGVSPHGCVAIYVPSATGGVSSVTHLSVTNSYFKNDLTCATNAIFVGTGNNNDTIDVTDDYFDGGFTGYASEVQLTVSSTPQTYAIASVGAKLKLIGQQSLGSNFAYFKLTNDPMATCGSTTQGSDYDGKFTGQNSFNNDWNRGSFDHICLVAPAQSLPATVFIGEHNVLPNWQPLADNSDTNCTINFKNNVLLNMPGYTGGWGLKNCLGLHYRNNFVYGFQLTSNGHGALAPSQMPGGTSASPNKVGAYDYSFNTVITPKLNDVPVGYSTTISNLLQSGWVSEDNLYIEGNTAVTNLPDMVFPGFTAGWISGAALYFASDGKVNLASVIRDNWIDPQGANKCFTSTGIQATVTGSISTTGGVSTLTATSVTGGELYPGEVISGIPGGSDVVVDAQTSIDPGAGGVPYGAGTYTLHTVQPTVSGTWNAFNTVLNNLTFSGNGNLTTGAVDVTLDTTTHNWGGTCTNVGTVQSH